MASARELRPAAGAAALGVACDAVGVSVTVGVGVSEGVPVGVGVGVAVSPGVAVGVGVGVASRGSPPKNVVRFGRETESPKIASSDAVTTTAAMPKASRPVVSASTTRLRVRKPLRSGSRRPNGSSVRSGSTSSRSSSGSWTSKSRPAGWRTAVPWGVCARPRRSGSSRRAS